MRGEAERGKERERESEKSKYEHEKKVQNFRHKREHSVPKIGTKMSTDIMNLNLLTSFFFIYNKKILMFNSS